VSKIDSLKYFYVINVNDLEYLKTSMRPALEAISRSDSTSSRTLPKVGDLIAARCSDGSWCRGKVKRNNKCGLYVCSVDFGDQEEIVTEFKTLPKDLADVKPTAHRCRFKNLPKGTEVRLSESNLSVLSQYFSADRMTATFFNDNEPFAVTLSLDGKDVFDTLNELIWEGVVPRRPFGDPIAEAKRAMLDEIVERRVAVRVVRVGPVASTEHFYVETKRCNELARRIRDEIDSAGTRSPVSRPAAGQTLIARCEKRRKLYRARLVWNYPGGGTRYRCFLVDRGEFEDCSEFYRPTTEWLLTAPPVKIHCSLDVAKLYSETVRESVARCFVDELATRSRSDRTVLEVREAGSPCVVQLRVNGLNVGDVIRPCPVRVIDVYKSFGTSRAFTARLSCAASRKVSDALKCTKTFREAENPSPRRLYAAELGDRFRRVKLIGTCAPSRHRVLEVDNQRSRFVVDRLYELPKSVADVQTTDLYCTLAPAPGDPAGCGRFSAKRFAEICDHGNTTFQMVVVKNDHANGHLVRLFLKSKDVSAEIGLQLP